MRDKPDCPECDSTSDVEIVTIGPHGEWGMIGWFCIGCQVEMDESGEVIRSYD